MQNGAATKGFNLDANVAWCIIGASRRLHQGSDCAASGVGAWSDGVGAWSDGLGAWRGGLGAWRGGVGAWSDGLGAWSAGSRERSGCFNCSWKRRAFRCVRAWNGVGAWSGVGVWSGGLRARSGCFNCTGKRRAFRCRGVAVVLHNLFRHDATHAVAVGDAVDETANATNL